MTTRPGIGRGAGVGTLSAAGSATQWCHEVTVVTEPVHHVDSAVEAVCASVPHRSSLVPEPLLGDALADILTRPSTLEQQPEDAGGRRARRQETSVRDRLAAPGSADCPPGARPRPQPVDAAEPAPPPGRAPRPAACPPERLSSLPTSPASYPGTARRIIPARPDVDPHGRAPTIGRGGRALPTWRAPRTRDATDDAGRPTVAAGDLGPGIAARLSRRIGAADVPAIAALGRLRVRATGPVTDLTAAALLALAAGRPPVEARQESDRIGPGEGATLPPGAGRRAPTARPAENRRAPDRQAATVRPGPPDPESLAPARLDRATSPIQREPLDDVQGLRGLARFAEQPARPRRLSGGPLADDTEAARGLPWTGAAPATSDVRAATTAVGLDEADLELVLSRILDDAARRHGIEV